ncbi:MAG TPA: DUF4365 domain-containing protein, partial [Thermoplasmatales archaeon]|nr:DUF4365 domain-containing protein [Thermoplasmatales archaeon]
MAKGKIASRFTANMRQELISRRQLSERLVEFGWIPNDPSLDLGEDFIVHVYLGGQATGVTFHIQEKSVSNLYDRRTASGDTLIYKFESKDLKHWETFDSPIVVLIVWDIELREGRWIFIDSAISDLDKRLPNWRNNKTRTSVHIPWENTTDDVGLTKLKQHVGHRWYPMIAQNKEVEIKVKLQFPSTENGEANREAYERFIKEGSEATFAGHIIQALEFSDWWDKWFGDYNPDNVMIVVSSRGSSKILPVSIAIIGNNDSTASLSNIELKNIQSGTEVIQVTNIHQMYPIHFKFAFVDPRKHKECNMSFQLNNWGNDAHEALSLLKFLHALMSGGELIITFLNRDAERLYMTVPPQPNLLTQQELQLFQRICQIQDKSGHIVRVPDDGITRKDEQAINELLQIFEYGQTSKKHNTVIVTGNRKMLEIMSDSFQSECNPINIRAVYPESFVKLFGDEVKTGHMIRTVTGKVEMSS